MKYKNQGIRYLREFKRFQNKQDFFELGNQYRSPDTTYVHVFELD